MAIRQAVAADGASLAALIDAAYSHYIPIIGRKPRPMLDDHAARIARGEHYVVEDGSLSAVITLTDGGDYALHILNIAVHPDAQGQGLLRQLLEFAEATARERHLGMLTLYTNVAMTKNRAIYKHLGFVELREEDAPGGYRIVFMERAIKAG